jgi:hypothetical protein
MKRAWSALFALAVVAVLLVAFLERSIGRYQQEGEPRASTGLSRDNPAAGQIVPPQVNPYLQTAEELFGRRREPPPPTENPFSARALGLETEQEMRMRVARQRADETTPERSAEVWQLATETGLPVSVVERNFEAISRRREAERARLALAQQQAGPDPIPWTG